MTQEPRFSRLRSRLRRLAFNLHPAFFGTGARIDEISFDYHLIRVRIPLSWRTRNYVGTIFGGAIYGAVDPFYMIMLIRILGPGYVVWDKAAAIRFKKPGRSTLFAEFSISDGEIEAIKDALTRERSIDRVYTVPVVSGDGTIHAVVEKTIHISRCENVGAASQAV